MLIDLLKKNRSYRRFFENERISAEQLQQWVGNCRLCASGRNAQPLKYALVHSPETCAEIFPSLTWAGYLKDWDGPVEGERPSAYIIQMLDTSIVENPLCDEGLQIQTIMLSAVEAGYGGCIIKAFNVAEIREKLGLPVHLRPVYVLALGKPKETVVLEEMKDNDIKYWRSEDQIHHVPKRPLSELVYMVK